MFYLHPWELDSDQPRPPMPWRDSFRHYVGVRKQVAKLSNLLARFHFSTARDVLGQYALPLPSAAPVSASAAAVRPMKLTNPRAEA